MKNKIDKGETFSITLKNAFENEKNLALYFLNHQIKSIKRGRIMASLFNNFTQLSPLSKTLRFELRPVGNTLDNLKKSGTFERDQERAQAYPEIKKILDDAHKKLLQTALCDAEISRWSDLAAAYETFRREKSQECKKDLENKQEEFRKKIADTLKADPDFENLTASTPSAFIEQLLAQNDAPSGLEKFKGFATYFRGFQENRKNTHSCKPIDTLSDTFSNPDCDKGVGRISFSL